MARTQARDLFDCRGISQSLELDRGLLRIAFVVYGGMNRKDWRTVLQGRRSFLVSAIAHYSAGFLPAKAHRLRILRRHAENPLLPVKDYPGNGTRQSASRQSPT